MTDLHEGKKQRSASGVQYVKDRDYAVPVTKKDVPPALKYAIEAKPVERTNRGTVLATVPGVKLPGGGSCGCFGGMIDDAQAGKIPWLYIFIPPRIPNPAAADYTARRGHPPAKTIPNMTQARKRQLRDICAKVGWELNTENDWAEPGDEDERDDGDRPGKDWTTLSNKGDDPEVRDFYKTMEQMRREGWHSWMIAPKGNFDKPEPWKDSVGQEREDDEYRRSHYNRHGEDHDDDVVATYGSMKTGDDDFSGFGRVTESTKVTLTVGQIKRLISECRTQTVIETEDPNPDEANNGGADDAATAGENATATQYFGLFNDGGNCWSRYGGGERWYWAKSWASEGETQADFRKRLRRMGEAKAQQNYREYVRGSYGVKTFSNWNDFEKAARKVGLNPKKPDDI